jgi:hypothetical protein
MLGGAAMLRLHAGVVESVMDWTTITKRDGTDTQVPCLPSALLWLLSALSPCLRELSHLGREDCVDERASDADSQRRCSPPPPQKRSVTLRDDTQRSIELTLWGKYANEPGDQLYNVSPVLQLLQPIPAGSWNKLQLLHSTRLNLPGTPPSLAPSLARKRRPTRLACTLLLR